jgi:hypothetical protein
VNVRAEPPAEVRPPRRPALRRIWDAPLWAHAAVLLVALLALLPVMSPESSFTQDEGAYALQVRSLEQGAWEYEYRARAIDPAGRWFPVVLSTKGDDGFYTYAKHPAYPLVLRAATSVAGTTLGLHLVALLGVVGAAAAAWLLAAEVDRSLSRPAFWVAAAGPVLVNGMLLWAHAPSAALAGLALVAAVRIARRGMRPLVTLGAVAALVAGVLLRSEGLLFAGALAAAVALMRFRAAGARPAVAALVALGGPSLVAALAERLWIRSIVGRTVEDLVVRGGAGSTPYLQGRFAGAFHSLFQAHDSVPAASVPVLAALGVGAGVGYVALRRWRSTSLCELTVAALGVAALDGARVVLHPTEAVTGLFAAWPVAALGLFLVRKRDRSPTLDLCLVASGLFAAAILLTQYPEGGGLEWGGRFFSPVTVPLAVVATVVLAHRLRSAPPPARGTATGAVAVLVAATAVLALVTVARGRSGQDRLIAAVGRHPAGVTVTTVDVFPRLAWRTHDRLNWMLTDDEGLDELVSTLHDAGVPDVVVVTRADVRRAAVEAYDDVRPVEQDVFGPVGATMLVLSDR